MATPIFVSWDYRPAVFFTDSAKGAYAVLKPGAPWKKVDRSDVGHTGSLMSEAEWRAGFEPIFGPLDLSKLPLPKAD